MKRLIGSFLASLLYMAASTQQSNVLPIGINDTVKNIPFSKFLSEKDSNISIESLKGKLVILDFWNVGCVGCIASMPKMDSLQKAFGDQIKIIYVTKNSKAQVERLFTKVSINIPDLPMVVEDSIYYDKLFPHEGDPMHVWIGQDGIVKAITWGYNTNATTIKAYLKSGEIKLATRTELEGFSYASRLLDESSGRLSKNVAYHSLLMKGLYEKTRISSMLIIKDTASKLPIGFKALNKSILSLFSFVFSKDIFGIEINMTNLVNNNRIILEMGKPEEMYRPAQPEKIDEWKKNNILSYEVVVPPEKSKNLFQIIQDDLNRMLDYSATMEKRKIACLVLKINDGVDKMKPIDPSGEGYVKNGSNLFSVRNMPISKSLYPALLYSNQSDIKPIINQTNYEGGIDLDIHSKLNDLPALIMELKRFNLLLVEEVCEIDMLVIRKRV